VIIMLEELTSTMAGNLRSAGKRDQADAVEAAAARIRDAVDLPGHELHEELLAIRHSADIILKIIDEMAPPAQPVVTRTRRTEAQRRDQHSRKTT
jgi:hypothetical protein